MSGRTGIPAALKSASTVLKNLKGADSNAVYGRLAGGLKAGSQASKQNAQIIPMVAGDIAANPGAVSVGDLGENLAARFGNAITGEAVQGNALGTALGVAYGQNPLVALGSNVLGNRAGSAVYTRLAAKHGADSARAKWGSGLANVGASMGGAALGDMAIGAVFGGGDQGVEESTQMQADLREHEAYMQGLRAQEQFGRTGTSQGFSGRFAAPIGATNTEQEAAVRAQYAQQNSQRLAPSNGGMRQMADLQANSLALRPQGRAEGMQFADLQRGQASMVEIPQLDAATADKLRKRAIENAQLNQFTATQLGGFMEGM